MQRIIIYGSDRLLGGLVEGALAGLGAERCYVARWEVLEALLDRREVALLLLLQTAEVLGLPQRLRALCRGRRRISLYAISWHHSEQMAWALLEQGVDQCFTLPLAQQRLRRKVIEGLCNPMRWE